MPLAEPDRGHEPKDGQADSCRWQESQRLANASTVMTKPKTGARKKKIARRPTSSVWMSQYQARVANEEPTSARNRRKAEELQVSLCYRLTALHQCGPSEKGHAGDEQLPASDCHQFSADLHALDDDATSGEAEGCGEG